MLFNILSQPLDIRLVFGYLENLHRPARELLNPCMANLAQLVRALDCESRGRGFDPHNSPQIVCKIFSILLEDERFMVFRSLSRKMLRPWHLGSEGGPIDTYPF